MTLKRLLHQQGRLRKKRLAREEYLRNIERVVLREVERGLLLLREEEQVEEEVREAYLSAVEEQTKIRTKELEIEVRDLKKQLAERPASSLSQNVDEREIQKASTICILDTILFAIENWTTDGQTAPDVTLASQSVLFSVVYDKVMSGDSDYYLDKFPVISMEVIRRGREFVKYIREDSPVALTTEDVWNKYAPQLQEWWINDALPLIFGARDDGWIDEEVYTYEEMIKWRDMPQSRLLDFPKVSDGMDLVARHMENIREQIGLRDFNLQQIQTRFNHE